MAGSKPAAKHPQVSAWRVSDVTDLHDFWPSSRFASPPGPFAAEVRRVQVGPVVVESIQTTPHSFHRDAVSHSAVDPPLVSIDVVTAGSLRREDTSGRYVQRAGDVAISSTAEPSTCVWLSRGRLIRSMLPLHLVEERTARHAPISVGRLADQSVMKGYAAFMTGLVDTRVDGLPIGVELERAVWWLQLALLRDAAHGTVGRGQPDLSTRVHAYIETHLFDRELSVPRIAQVLQISIRSVHHAFDGRGTTAARSIRMARAHAVASSLRAEHSVRPHAVLAREFGFSSAEALQRAFSEVFGMRIAEYRRVHPTALESGGNGLQQGQVD